MNMNDNQLYYEDFQAILSRAKGLQVKVVCPLCHDKRSNKADRALSINTQTLEYHCHYCGVKGVLKNRNEEDDDTRYYRSPKKTYVKPIQKQDNKMFSKSFIEYFKNRGISEKTLNAARVSQETEYFPQKQAKIGCIGFNYYLDNELVNVKYRTRDKDFKLISGARLIPYNIDSIASDKFNDGEEKYAVITEGECFSDNAEILTTNGWKTFKDLRHDDLVAQYWEGIIEFVKPTAFVKKRYNGKLVEFSKKRHAFYSLTTPNHNMVVISRKGNVIKKKACEVNSQTNVVRSGMFDGEGVNFTDDELRLFCAVSADFTLRKSGDLYAVFKKKRKVERTTALLDRIGVRYSNNVNSRGYNSIFIHRGHDLFVSKDFPMEWISRLSKHQIEVILEEIIHWDGNHVNNRTMLEYNSNRYNNVLFIQTLCHLNGRRSTICRRHNKHGSWYKATIIKNCNTTISKDEREDVDYDGYVYCVTVPSGMIMVRQNEQITISGNCDALTYIECGMNHVVSVPNGANNNTSYLDDFIEDYFDKMEAIYISVDNDNKGLELRKELIRRFGEDRCRIIDYPKPCKDINEVLVQYGKDEVIKCFKSYTEIKPDGVKDLHDYETDLDYLFYNGFEPGVKIGVASFDEIISFKVGLVTVITGVPSSGKSFALNYIMARLNILHDWKIAYFSPEFYPVHEHLGQILETYGGKRFVHKNYNEMEYQLMKEYIENNIFIIDPNDTDINSILERAIYLVRKRAIKVLVIDPFNSITDKERKIARQDEYVSDFMQKLRGFARKYAIAIFIVMHPVKQVKLENGLYPVCDLYDCKGGAEIRDKADIGITIWRNDFKDYVEMHITKVKFRHLGTKGHATFKFNINNGRFVEIDNMEEANKMGINIDISNIEWDNSNWILEKLKMSQVQQQMELEAAQNDTIPCNNAFTYNSNMNDSYNPFKFEW